MSVKSPKRYLEALRDHGVIVLERDGWEHNVSAGGWDPLGVMHHHTAGNGKLLTSRTTQEAMRRILWSGHAALTGPLSHLGLAWQPWKKRAVAHTTGWGNCNHAGRGDSRVMGEIARGTYDGRIGTREDADGNPFFYGLEYMHPGDDTPWPDELLEIGVRCGAALSELHGWPARVNLEHFEWASGRKSDRSIAKRGQHDIRAEVARIMNGGGDMPLSDEDVTKIWKEIKSHEAWFRNNCRVSIDAELVQQRPELVKAVVDEVVARLPVGEAPTAQTVAEAVIDVLAARAPRLKGEEQ